MAIFLVGRECCEPYLEETPCLHRQLNVVDLNDYFGHIMYPAKVMASISISFSDDRSPQITSMQKKKMVMDLFLS